MGAAWLKEGGGLFIFVSKRGGIGEELKIEGG